MRIATEDLRVVCNKLLSQLEEDGVTSVDISEDFYWEVSSVQRYRPDRPDELTLGQLSSDWSSALAIAMGDRAPLGYSLVWLASVLRRVGEKHPG